MLNNAVFVSLDGDDLKCHRSGKASHDLHLGSSKATYGEIETGVLVEDRSRLNIESATCPEERYYRSIAPLRTMIICSAVNVGVLGPEKLEDLDFDLCGKAEKRRILDSRIIKAVTSELESIQVGVLVSIETLSELGRYASGLADLVAVEG